MCRIWTVSLAATLVTVCAGAGPKTPAARVLEIKGNAIVQEADEFERPAALFGTIYADERLVVAKGSQVTLVFRGDGHVERVAAPGSFQVTVTGCQPTDGVEQLAMPEKHRATVGKISKGPRGIVQGGVVMLRSPAPPSSSDSKPADKSMASAVEPAPILPIADSTLLSDKPLFSWPAVPEAKKYKLSLYFRGNRVWSGESDAARIEYAGEPLRSGAMYSWEAETESGGEPISICEGMFRTASERQRTDAAALAELLAEPTPAYLALAALWYKQNGFVEDAIAVNEQLAKLNPDAAVYRELAELYFQAGQDDKANAAEAKAGKMEK